MSGGAVLWAETPDEDRDETPDCEAHGDVDESFAARRLRRWLKGMFGGAAERPVRESGPGEGVRGNREVPPTDHPQS
jgi:hypothetical protein